MARRKYPKEEIDKLITSKLSELGAPDLILQPDQETRIAPEGDDETRCFVLPSNLKEDRWINAIDFQPGAGTVVYSASLFIVPPSGGKTPAKAGTTNNCPPNAEPGGQWAGAVGQPSSEWRGHQVAGNSSLVTQVRYRKNGQAGSDRSSVGLYFAKDPPGKLVPLLQSTRPRP